MSRLIDYWRPNNATKKVATFGETGIVFAGEGQILPKIVPRRTAQ
jgi:hypothetical protein